MIRLRFRLISPAILSAIIFPPLGLSGLFYLIAGFILEYYGKPQAAERSFEVSNRMIKLSVYGFLTLMLIGTSVVFWMGGNLISVIGSFY